MWQMPGFANIFVLEHFSSIWAVLHDINNIVTCGMLFDASLKYDIKSDVVDHMLSSLTTFSL